MELKDFVIQNYPVVRLNDCVDSIKKRLLQHQYLVALDDDAQYHGILSLADLVANSDGYVLNCLSKKEVLHTTDSLSDIFDKFAANCSHALPVFENNKFYGVVVQDHLAKAMQKKAVGFDEHAWFSEKSKEYYLNNLSHEIRTPLNGIIGFLDILAYFDIDDSLDEIKDISEVIKKSAKHFLTIMDDLVALSQLHAGNEKPIEKSEVNVAKILADLQYDFQELPLVNNKKAHVRYLNKDLYVSVFLDEKKLKSILYHLIDNAVKFSINNEAEYGFEFSDDGDKIIFVVRNEGTIEDEYIDNMFGYFVKQKKVGTELNPGLGIGLPLVKHFTELMGGHIHLELEHRQVTFYVTIPLEQNPAFCNAE